MTGNSIEVEMLAALRSYTIKEFLDVFECISYLRHDILPALSSINIRTVGELVDESRASLKARFKENKMGVRPVSYPRFFKFVDESLRQFGGLYGIDLALRPDDSPSP